MLKLHFTNEKKKKIARALSEDYKPPTLMMLILYLTLPLI